MNKTKKITCIIQARTNSSRLPDKILLKLSNTAIIVHIIDRIKKINSHLTNNSGYKYQS